MTTGQATVPLAAHGRGQDFPPVHPADRFYFPLLLAWIWAGLLFGFIPPITKHFADAKPPYLLIVDLHSMIFVGWMVLLTVQVSLVRGRKLALHRSLGRIGFYLAPTLVLVGLVTSVMVNRSHFGTPRWDPQFLSVQLADLINFALMVTFALRMRTDGASHKRLMLLAATALSNAGFGRWWGPALGQWLGEGYLAELAGDYAGDFVILAIMVIYDLATRGRLNGAFVRGAGVLIGIELLAPFLYLNAGWIAFSDALQRP